VEKIFKYVGLWDLKDRPSPKVKASGVRIQRIQMISYEPLAQPSFAGKAEMGWN
jgi:hypothetical protein